MTERARVQNAASGSQVRRARRAEKDADRIAALDAKAVMASIEGRRFVWWLLKRAGVNLSVMRDGETRALYWAGRQDCGHELLAHIIATDSEAYLLMQREAIEAQTLTQLTVPEEEPGMLSEPPADGGDDD
jgi:hypothetical protein